MATRPVQWLLVDYDWRHIFLALAVITVAVALYQLLARTCLRTRRQGQAEQRSARPAGHPQDAALLARGPGSTFSLGVWICYTSFWAAGWLRDVAHLDEPSVGVALFALSIAIIPGYFFSGMIVDLLHRRGIRGGRVLLVYGLLFLAIHVPIALNVTAMPKLLWFAYVMLGGMPVVCYALVTRAFAPSLPVGSTPRSI